MRDVRYKEQISWRKIYWVSEEKESQQLTFCYLKGDDEWKFQPAIIFQSQFEVTSRLPIMDQEHDYDDFENLETFFRGKVKDKLSPEIGSDDDGNDYLFSQDNKKKKSAFRITSIIDPVKNDDEDEDKVSIVDGSEGE